MRTITVPRDMTINLGYRKLKVKAGRRTYPDEVANHQAMIKYWDAEPAKAGAVKAAPAEAPVPQPAAPVAAAPAAPQATAEPAK